MTPALPEARDFRITIDPNDMNGLRVRSEAVADKPHNRQTGAAWPKDRSHWR
jgi:hypothetical protein